MRQKTTWNYTTLWTPPPGLVCERASVAWGIDDGILKEYPADTVRILKPFGLLCEDEKTNFLLYSRNQTESEYTATNCTTARNETGLDGIENTATTITTTSTSGMVEQVFDLLPDQGYYTFSLFAKLKGYTTSASIFIKLAGNDNEEEIQVFPNESGFIRAEVTTLLTSGISGVQATAAILISEDGVELITDQWQLEPGIFPSSPIITEDSEITRTAEELYMDVVVNVSGDPELLYTNIWLNKEEGVFTVLHTSSNESEGCAIMIQESDDSGDDFLYLGMDRSATETMLVGGINDTESYVITEQETDQSDTYSLTMCYMQGVQLFALNNAVPVAPNSQSETFDLSSATRMWIGNDRGTKQINGYIQEITYFSNFMQLSDAVNGLIEQPVELGAPELTLVGYDSEEVEFSYTLVKNATNYVMEVANSDDFSEIIESDILIGTTGTYTYIRTTIVREYWFRIRAITPNENGPYSNSIDIYYEAYLFTQNNHQITTQDGKYLITQ